MDMAKQSVVQYYSGKSVFVTGVTGFIGKVLVEKLLFSCPDIENIYILLRSGKDGKSPTERFESLLQSPAFQFRCLPLEKVIPIVGDISKPGLGLAECDRLRLVQHVSVVFHIAANVKFNGPLDQFIEQNTLSSEHIMDFAQEIINLESVVYVSTAYSNCHLKYIEERVYPFEETAQDIVQRIRTDRLTPKEGDPVLKNRPNPYILSKALAENLIIEKYRSLPVVICRPSIVTNSYNEPVQGWCDNVQGISGIFLLGQLGILRSMEFTPHFKADIIPVDVVANALLVIGWHCAMFTEARPEVVHLVSGTANPVVWDHLQRHTRINAQQIPASKLVRPVSQVTGVSGRLDKVTHLLVVLFSHYLFAYVFDLIVFLTGNQRFMVKIVQRLDVAFANLLYFSTREWDFQYANYRRIYQMLSEDEKKIFFSDIGQVDWTEYSKRATAGNRRYLLKEDDSTIEKAILRQNMIHRFYPIALRSIQLAILVIAFYTGKRLFTI